MSNNTLVLRATKISYFIVCLKKKLFNKSINSCNVVCNIKRLQIGQKAVKMV